MAPIPFIRTRLLVAANYGPYYAVGSSGLLKRTSPRFAGGVQVLVFEVFVKSLV